MIHSQVLAQLTHEIQAAAGGWLFSQPVAIIVALLAAGVACLGLYWFANLHARTLATATADMKAGMTAMAEAFTKDQERDKEVFVRELEKNRDLVRTVMEQMRSHG